MRNIALMALLQTGAFAAVVLTFSVLMTQTGAVAETESYLDAIGDQASGSLDIRDVNIDNGAEAITATIGVDGLADGTGDKLYLNLDIGPGDNDVDYYSYLVSTTQQGDAPATLSIQTEISKTRPTELMTKARCRTSSAVWDVPADQVRIRIPQTCLGDNAGAFDAEVFLRDAETQGSDGARSHLLLQRGDAGAAPYDVNGDGRVDRVVQSTPSPSRYRVTVHLGKRTVSATGPRNPRWYSPPRKATSGLDLNRDGRAEVIGNPGAGQGSSEHHVFTLSQNRLRLVRFPDGKPFTLGTTRFRCADGLVFRYSTALVGTYPEVRYSVSGTVWDLRGDRVHRVRTIHRTLSTEKAEFGGWSYATCSDGMNPDLW